ncbi:MAG: HU family DNA-binding protein [Caldimicrobium sp.]|nr:HU family DNA-binding protein [Caldimicrobium sp.]MCX7873313.1 HU family DNA-binding protein [Caldimicrobium sp.]MDW8093449.1 HU family DNA-binding protein [Caldimicrobium sp.]
MTKRELTERLRKRFIELEAKDLDFIIDQFFEILGFALKRGLSIELRDFGVFKLSQTRSYFFKNPKTQQRYYLKGKVKAVFQLGKSFKERLNQSFLASLDLGTQSFRLLLGKYFKNEPLFLKSFRENVRLGEGVVESGLISPSAQERALEVLRNFKKIMEDFEVSEYFAVGTAVFRRAKNAREFQKRIEEELGLKVEILSSEEEAKLILEGIFLGLRKLGLNLKEFLIVDVGGGSTEFVYIKDGVPQFTKSLELGVVLLRDFFKFRYPMTKKMLTSLRSYVGDQLLGLPPATFEKIIVTGGSASLLGSLDLKLARYDFEALHGHRITPDRIENLITKISEATLPRIRRLRGMEEGREDLALPGLIIYSEILKYFQGKELILSEYGILEGIFTFYSKRL